MRSFHPLAKLAELTSSDLVGDPLHAISDVADLESATSEDASFYANSRYQRLLERSAAGVICVDRNVSLVPGRNYLISDTPSETFQKLIDLFHPQPAYASGFMGIHPSAVIHESAQLEKEISIGPHAVVDAGVKIGRGTFIGAGVYIGMDCCVGEECFIHPHVTLRERTVIGNRVIIQPGAVIGACGFGYATSMQGVHKKFNQVGHVVIEDEVEIGANTTIDRARFKSTRIGRGTKIDNLVQIGHGVVIGPHNLLVAQVGIGGSSSTEEAVILAGQVGVVGHVHLKAGVVVAAKAGVTKNLSKGRYAGYPAIPVEEYNRIQARIRRFDKK